MPSNNLRRFGGAVASAVAMASLSSVSSAAPPWVERSVILPQHDWAFDFGLGMGHLDLPDPPTGSGLNAEFTVAVTSHLELGVRTGFRFGVEGRKTRADEYGRLFDRQSFGTNQDSVANPEFRLRGALISGDVVELAFEGRAALPIEEGSKVGLQFGMPLWFHLGLAVRLDTGVYVPVVFHDPTALVVSVPVDVWIQCSPRLWLGPMSGVRVNHQGERDGTDVSLGFGLGYSLASTVDLKTMALAPAINHTAGARNFGLGVGLQIRIE